MENRFDREMSGGKGQINQLTQEFGNDQGTIVAMKREMMNQLNKDLLMLLLLLCPSTFDNNNNRPSAAAAYLTANDQSMHDHRNSKQEKQYRRRRWQQTATTYSWRGTQPVMDSIRSAHSECRLKSKRFTAILVFSPHHLLFINQSLILYHKISFIFCSSTILCRQ